MNSGDGCFPFGGKLPRVSDVFGFGKRKRPAPPRDPLQAFDALVEELEAQASEVRKGAATLLAVRSELGRNLERYAAREKDLHQRLREADRRHDAAAQRLLTRDGEETGRRLAVAQTLLARVDSDAELLMHKAQELKGKLEELHLERQSASAQWRMGQAVGEALRAQAERFTHRVALDAARDDLERAHALADVYRDDARPDES